MNNLAVSLLAVASKVYLSTTNTVSAFAPVLKFVAGPLDTVYQVRSAVLVVMEVPSW